MEELRSPLPLVPRDQNARGAAGGDELGGGNGCRESSLLDDLRGIPRYNAGGRVFELWEAKPFARVPRRRFFVFGSDAAEAIRLCGRKPLPAYEGGCRWHRSDAVRVAENRVLVTVHFEPTFGAEWSGAAADRFPWILC